MGVCDRAGVMMNHRSERVHLGLRESAFGTLFWCVCVCAVVGLNLDECVSN